MMFIGRDVGHPREGAYEWVNPPVDDRVFPKTHPYQILSSMFKVFLSSEADGSSSTLLPSCVEYRSLADIV